LNLADGFAALRKAPGIGKVSDFRSCFADREDELLQRRGAAVEIVAKAHELLADIGERLVMGN
jgi:hypothetical protein